MAAYVIRARLMLIGCVAVISVLACVFMVFKLGTRDAISQLQTHELLAILTLLVLPWVCIWAFHAESRAMSKAGAPQPGEAGRGDHPHVPALASDPALGHEHPDDGTRSVRDWACVQGAPHLARALTPEIIASAEAQQPAHAAEAGLPQPGRISEERQESEEHRLLRAVAEDLAEFYAIEHQPDPRRTPARRHIADRRPTRDAVRS